MVIKCKSHFLFSRIKHRAVGLLLLITALMSMYANEVQAQDVQAPEELSQWKDWLLWSHPELSCALTYTEDDTSEVIPRQCLWTSAMSINIDKGAIHFSQEALLQKEMWLALPGDAKLWPSRVKANNKIVSIVAKRDGRPYLLLAKGSYSIQGSIPIDTVNRLTELHLPKHTALVMLKRNGVFIKNPLIVNSILMLTNEQAEVNTATNALNLQVFRLLSDAYPMQLTSKIELNVSGDTRVETMGRVIPENFEITNINSALPLRLNSHGDMQIQVEAGSWIIEIASRYKQSANSSATFNIEPHKNWPAQELWSFAPDRRYRIVDVAGNSIDASQTNLPQAWQSYSTFLIEEDRPLIIEEKTRGNSQPDAHELELERDMWLSFNGKYFTSRSYLKGQFNTLDRLSATSNYDAGRIEINQQPALLTTVDGDQGVEVLTGNVEIKSVGLVNKATKIAINPWKVRVNSASLTLHLPPGYSLFSVTGADSVYRSYVSTWTLWKIFIVILFVVILVRQYNVVIAIMGLLYALSVHQVSGAPPVFWLLLLVGGHVMLGYIPDTTRLKSIGGVAYKVGFVLIGLSFLPFAINQARLAIYPQLEKPYHTIVNHYATQNNYNSASEAMEIEPSLEEAYDMDKQLTEVKRKVSKSTFSSRVSKPLAKKMPKRYQENLITQTGPSIPAWEWNTFTANWYSTVATEQEVSIRIIPPWVNRPLALLRIILFIGFILAFLRFQRKHNKNSPPDDRKGLSTTLNTSHMLVLALLMGGLSSYSPPASAEIAQISQIQLLHEYESRLQAPPTCWPDCVAINKAVVSANADTLRLTLFIDALAQTSVPLPLDKLQISYAIITQDNKPVTRLANNEDTLLLLMEKGQHQVVITFDVTERNQVVLPFKLIPHRVETQLDGWMLSGVDANNIVGNSLHLKKRQQTQTTSKKLSPAPIAPYVEVRRVIDLGIEWKVTTYVTRKAPNQGAIHVAIPLLQGESVNSTGIKVKAGAAQVDFSETLQQVEWESHLATSQTLKLQAKESDVYYERWQLNPSLQWHVNFDGLAPIKTQNEQLTWYPRHGDTLNIYSSKPSALAGESLTVDSVKLSMKPGRHQFSYDLALTIRASKGSDYLLPLPKNAQIKAVKLNEQSIIYNTVNGQISLPVKPGNNVFVIQWTEAKTIGIKVQTPAIEIKATNIEIITQVPQTRWVLGVFGPAIGPAVLFWGVAFILVLVSIFLGMQSWSPLKTWQWLLLTLGIATSTWIITTIIILWFVIIANKAKLDSYIKATTHRNQIKIILLILSAIMLLALAFSVAYSLLFGSPRMGIIGNGSSSFFLQWYQDSSVNLLPVGTVISLPMWMYRLMMLLWSIWLSFSLIKWLTWAWQSIEPASLWDKSTLPKKPIKKNDIPS